MTFRTETITRGERLAYLARPEDATHAGVLLLPSVHGIDQYSRLFADSLAEAGLDDTDLGAVRRPAHSAHARGARRAAGDTDRRHIDARDDVVAGLHVQ